MPQSVEESASTEEPAAAEEQEEDPEQGILTPQMAQAYRDAILQHGQEYDKCALMNIDANGLPQLCLLKESCLVSIFSVDENGNLIEFGKDDMPDFENGVFGLGTYSRYIYSMAGSGKIVSTQTGTGGAGR